MCKRVLALCVFGTCVQAAGVAVNPAGGEAGGPAGGRNAIAVAPGLAEPLASAGLAPLPRKQLMDVPAGELSLWPSSHLAS